MRTSTLIAAVVAAGGLLRSPVIWAENREAAERAFKIGAKAYAAQNFAGAAAAFDEAYAADPLPEIAFSTAQAYRRLFRVDPKPEYAKRSVELYRIYLDKVKTGARVGDAADSLGEMLRELDRIGVSSTTKTAPAVEHTRLAINVSVIDQAAADTTTMREIGDATGEAMKGVKATLDGKPVEPFAFVDVTAGDHVVTVTADGYYPVEKHQPAAQGVSAYVDVDLKPKPATLAIDSESDARVIIDGKAVQGVPGTPFELAAGKHLVAILRDGRTPFAREISATRGETVKLAAPLHSTTQRRAVPYVLAGAGVLAAGALTTMTVALVHDGRASSLNTTFNGTGNASPADADRYASELASRDRYATATWILGSAAVGAAVIGVGLWRFDHPSLENMQVVPTVTSQGGGVSAGGRF